MVSQIAYTVFIAATGAERLVEMVVSKQNAAWAFARGGVERGRGHFGFMVVLHTAFLIGCVAEVWLLERPFIPALGFSMLGLAVGAQALRWWVIKVLGRRWNTRVIVVPGLDRIESGPFRWIRHPSYLAVVLEGLALPLIHTAWLTAIVFSTLNAGLLMVRIRCEEEALDFAEKHPTEVSP